MLPCIRVLARRLPPLGQIRATAHHVCRTIADVAAAAAAAAAAAPSPATTLLVTEAAGGVVTVTLNRPTKSNAMNGAMWRELRTTFDAIAASSSARVVVLCGAGRNFTSGLDLLDHQELAAGAVAGADVSRTAWRLRGLIEAYQASLTAITACPKPVIAAIHGACIGGGVDMVCAADVRLASIDATFCVKEVQIGMAADVGTLQRFPRLIGNDSLVRELCLTGRNWPAEEAARAGFLSSVHLDGAATLAAAQAMAARIAALSPLAVQGTKVCLNYSRDHSVADGLAHAALWNAAMLQGGDVGLAVGSGGAAASFPNL